MAGFTRTFGSTPRTKLIEALIRLGPVEVTRGELAAEAGVWRASANRVISGLEKDGLVMRVRSGTRPVYRACVESPEFDLLAYFASALEYMQLGSLTGPESSLALDTAKELVRHSLSSHLIARTTNSVQSSTVVAQPNMPLLTPAELRGGGVISFGNSLISGNRDQSRTSTICALPA